MLGTQRDCLKPVKKPRWLSKVPGRLRALVEAHVDARAESAAAIFRRFNLIRYCSARTFRGWVKRRRLAIEEYEWKRYEKTGRPPWEAVKESSDA